MSTFRRPYLSVFLASIILIVSCKPQEIESLNEFEVNNERLLENFVTEHIALTRKLSEALYLEKNINLDLLGKSLKSNQNYDDLLRLLREVNIENAEEITRDFRMVQENTNNFIRALNTDSVYSEQEVLSLITEEIHHQMQFKSDGRTSREVCGDQLNEGNFRCDRNYAIALTAAAVSAFFTFGVGTAIGVTAAAAVHAVCRIETFNDFQNCVAEMN